MISIVGLCRFSFVGRGDWTSYRDPAVDQNDPVQRRRTADALYDPDRLEKRFFVFEKLLLNSLDMQTDPDFRLLVLTSDMMPPSDRDRLVALCRTRPYAHPIFSDATDVNSGFMPEIDRIRTGPGHKPEHRIVQFRIDDDDGLASDYIERLRRAAVAMAGYPNFTYSRPRGAVVTLYKDEAPKFYQLNQLFHAAGCACRLNRRNMTIFSYGHFALRDRFPALIDNSGTGHLALKLQDHDSENLDSSEQARRGHHAMTKTDFSRLLEDQFPFIDLDTISGLR